MHGTDAQARDLAVDVLQEITGKSAKDLLNNIDTLHSP
jgi:hypothetical protein